jgi:hypothetical protein
MKTENLFEPGCIRTFSGKYIDPLNPNPDLICIEDIAHSLSMQCRFGGHTRQFYSVAQHSVMCALKLPDELKLAGLLHDASEAYLMDIPSPVKRRLTNYKEIENNLMKVIADKFGFAWPLDQRVHEIDREELQLEWDYYVVQSDISFEYPLTPKFAKLKFLDIYVKLDLWKS